MHYHQYVVHTVYSDKGVNAESRVSRIDGCGGFDFDGVYKNI